MRRGVSLVKQPEIEFPIPEQLYDTSLFWTMTRFDAESPSIKVQSFDLPLADGSSEFLGFSGNIYYNSRTINISLECSERDYEFRQGEITKLNCLLGQNMHINCNWTEKLQFKSLEVQTSEMGEATIEGIVWEGRLISVKRDFANKYHAGITLVFMAKPYKKANVRMSFLAGVNYQNVVGIGFSIPNFSDDTTASIFHVEKLSIKVSTLTDSSQTYYEGEEALQQIKLVKHDRGSYVLYANSLVPLQKVEFLSPATVVYEGVTML